MIDIVRQPASPAALLRFWLEHGVHVHKTRYGARGSFAWVQVVRTTRVCKDKERCLRKEIVAR